MFIHANTVTEIFEEKIQIRKTTRAAESIAYSMKNKKKNSIPVITVGRSSVTHFQSAIWKKTVTFIPIVVHNCQFMNCIMFTENLTAFSNDCKIDIRDEKYPYSYFDCHDHLRERQLRAIAQWKISLHNDEVIISHVP